jgi:tetratricopeptide (TPR) repeat protein
LKQYNEALADLNRAVELNPGDAQAITSRSDTYQEMKRYDEALADFNRAIELNPCNAWAIAGRGTTYLEMKRYNEALADLNRALELDPGYAWAITRAARSTRRWGVIRTRWLTMPVPSSSTPATPRSSPDGGWPTC